MLNVPAIVQIGFRPKSFQRSLRRDRRNTQNKTVRTIYIRGAAAYRFNRYFAVPIFFNPGTFLPVPLNQTYKLALRTPSLFDNS